LAAVADLARSVARESQSPIRPAAPAPAVTSAAPTHPSPAGAIALQRAVGNRAATRLLSRWVAHPDKNKKGVLMPDAMAAEFLRFNPPLSK
jgi:hypothetical protein